MRILIAEDDLDLNEAIKAFLEKNKFSVESVDNGEDAVYYAETMDFDLIILDIMMPKLDGIQVLNKLRNEGISVPIMILTAKSLTKDKVLGLDSGADDYLCKPFHPDELLSRIKALLRRGKEFTPLILKYHDVSLNTNNGQLTSTSGKSIRLTGREFQILELFLRYPNQTFSADKIIEKIWDYETDTDINSIWVHLSNIRKKLKSVDSKVEIIAVRSLGYTLDYKEN